MKLPRPMIMLLCAYILSACTPSIPRCNDKNMVSTVEGIYKGEPGDVMSAVSAMFEYKVGTIRTISTDGSTGVHTCAAILTMTSTANSQLTFPKSIEYKIEKIDDTGEIYVSILK